MTNEVLGAMQIVQVFNQEERERERFRAAVQTALARIIAKGAKAAVAEA